MAIILTNLRPSGPASAGGTGALLVDIAALGLVRVVLTNRATGAIVLQAFDVAPAVDYRVSGLPPATYGLNVFNAEEGEVQVLFSLPSFRGGCTDPLADNYDPLATADNGSCAYAPRLELATALPVLAANGRPVLVTLSSAVIAGAVSRAAEGFIRVAASVVGVSLRVNGYALTLGPLRLATSFADAPTLLEALLGIPALAADYLIRAGSQPDEVRLTARVPGTAYNLALSSSDPAAVVVAAQPGTDTLRSQGRPQWACFLEVWTGAPAGNPGTFSDLYTDAYRDAYGLLVGATGAVGQLPVLAQRLELDYREGNAYAFDIAPALRQFTGHAYPLADGSCPDRLVSYFLRYGELFAQPGTTRRQQTAYQSGVAWALDAVEIVPPFAPNAYLLSRRPGPWRTGPRGPAATLLLGNEPGPASLSTVLSRRAFDGSTSNQPAPPIAQGRVSTLRWPVAFLPDYLTAFFTVAAPGGTLVSPTLEVVAGEAAELTFANGQGGFERFLFEGTREKTGKRTAADYATPTGMGVRAATVPESFRLNSGPLPAGAYAWLCRELGNSPAVWLETAAGPVPIRLSAFSPEADEGKGEYFLSVECEPLDQPALGLTN